jgi:hypothetical protein
MNTMMELGINILIFLGGWMAIVHDIKAAPERPY